MVRSSFGPTRKSGSLPSAGLIVAAIVNAPADHDAADRQGAAIAKAQENRGQKIQLVDDDLGQLVLDLLLHQTRGLGVANEVTKDLSGVEGIGTFSSDEIGEVLENGPHRGSAKSLPGVPIETC